MLPPRLLARTVSRLPSTSTVHRFAATRHLTASARALHPLDIANDAAASASAPPPMPSKQSQPSRKKEGSIADVFASLSQQDATLPARFAELKQSLVRDEKHAELLRARFDDVLDALRGEVELIRNKGADLIPHVEYNGASGSSWLSQSSVEQIKQRGVAVIKNVIPAEEVLRWKAEIQEYARLNKAKGFPSDNPQVYELYWTKQQLAARAHPALLDVSRSFLHLFHQAPDASRDPSRTVSLRHPMTYCDRLRIRQPGDAQFALGPHIDGGGVERWEGENFRNVFRRVLQPEGTAHSWRAHDSFDIGASGERILAETSMYDGAGQCSVLRTWQGWLAMSETRQMEGTLRVLPLLKEASAYIMLRPFFQPKNKDVNAPGFLDAENWTLDTTSSTFPGCSLGHNIELSDLTHPHLDLSRTMTSIPHVSPGDMVLWHCDLVHSVEAQHRGRSDSSVLYIPAIPLTQQNMCYVQAQRACFEQGLPPPDFPGGDGESAFQGRGQTGDVRGEEARCAMGLQRIAVSEAVQEAERKLIEACNALV